MAAWTKKWNLWRFILCSLLIASTLSLCIQGARADEQNIPTESECRPYIEKALKDLEHGDSHSGSQEDKIDSAEAAETTSAEDSSDHGEDESAEVSQTSEADAESNEEEEAPVLEVADEPYVGEVEVESDEAEPKADSGEDGSQEQEGEDASNETADDKDETEDGDSNDASAEEQNAEDAEESAEVKEDDAEESGEDKSGEVEETEEKDVDSKEATDEASVEDAEEGQDGGSEEGGEEASEEGGEEASEEDGEKASEETGEEASVEGGEEAAEDTSGEAGDASAEEGSEDKSGEETDAEADSKEEASQEQTEDSEEQAEESEKESDDSKEQVDEAEDSKEEEEEGKSKEETDESQEQADESKEQADEAADSKEDAEESKETEDSEDAKEVSEEEIEASEAQKDEAEAPSETESEEGEKAEESAEGAEESAEGAEESAEGAEESAEESAEETPEEDLLLEVDIPENLRPRDHIDQMLRLDDESIEADLLMEKSADIILRQLKNLYDTAIKPLETLYKYRDLSNRHFGDPEIFSKSLILFMGPWSGGKSSLINYLTNNEFSEWSLRTGAEPSPAYFNILMHGNEPEVLDGTQLAADWTFSGLQKFGQGLEERLRGLKLPSKLLERVNIVEIPGILEVRKQVSRVFPFNDACQWFIDRADVIFLVYDPSKLDVGPETEAILDQLKGRESQTRIILNKADQVKPEELLRVQSALIWNISPLMSSAQPPVMYTTSLWSMPYESGAPIRLLHAQEKAFLRDLREAMDRRIDNKISSARRFAVRVRNHAKMVDCYLTTYYNHKTIFANKKVVSEAIIEHPQNYHIYEGLSTLTNISRYDLPDPETYRDFFRLNPLYEFQQLSATCTYFRGCPINRLDIAIAYDLPELVGKYKKMVESATPQGMPKS